MAKIASVLQKSQKGSLGPQLGSEQPLNVRLS